MKETENLSTHIFVHVHVLLKFLMFFSSSYVVRVGYINDLSVVKDNIKLRVRIVSTWMQELYGKQHIKNMELIVMDEHEYRKRPKDHWRELEAIRILEEDYVHEPEPECDDDENRYECFDYDDLHLAYPAEKSPKWNF
ncbi:hypothetical protein Tco_1209918 [Tanacetum coccineum]